MDTRRRVEVLQSAAEGGIITDENKTDYGFMKELLNIGRGMAITEIYRNDNNIDETFMQSIHLSNKDLVQEDDCWTVYSVPRLQLINNQINGGGYLGSARQDKNWRQVRNLMQWSNINNKRIGNPSTGIYWMVEPELEFIRVFSREVRDPFMQSVFADPFDSRLNFNEELDNYPISDQAFGLVEKWLRNGMMRDIIRNMPNVISDSQEAKVGLENKK